MMDNSFEGINFTRLQKMITQSYGHPIDKGPSCSATRPIDLYLQQEKIQYGRRFRLPPAVLSYSVYLGSVLSVGSCGVGSVRSSFWGRGTHLLTSVNKITPHFVWAALQKW